MREIKFKVWDKENKEWVGENVGGVMDLIYSMKHNCFMFDNDNFDIPKEIEVCQYTGLKDKNGKEIYEGDIIKSDNYKEEVVFKNGSFEANRYISYGTYPSGLKMAGGTINILNEECEVIGNIYEHSHLLN